ncbi:MAG: hypothetical protein HY393_00405 [Candidatus Diapherotrites archaeon]|nr:hypothetical protein [Candidatus Diapherotrites archaeon]
MPSTIVFQHRLDAEEVTRLLHETTFRGMYDTNGSLLRPYENARFYLAHVKPPPAPTNFPQIYHNGQPQPLFTPQPTIYRNQTAIMEEVDEFLKTIGKRIYALDFEGIQYHWEGKGDFHVLPPIVEKHVYPLKQGVFDLEKLSERFKGAFVRDARGNLHSLADRTIKDYYVDTYSKVAYMDVFNHNAELLNYGLQFNGPHIFYVVCDGSHRLDYAMEILNQPINVILVESENLFPYYAFPMPFRPTTRLTSKEAEKLYPKLERDKVHLLNDFIKKILHYDWGGGQLHVSSLRQQSTIY